MSAIYCNQCFPAHALSWCSLVEMLRDTSPFQKRMEIVVLEMEEEIAGGEGEGKKEQVFKSKSALF